MNPILKEIILKCTSAISIKEIEEIQELWSGYGQIVRLKLKGGDVPSVVVKNIDLSQKKDHPRGWNTSASFNRKSKSYDVEQVFYEKYAIQCNDNCRVANFIASDSIDGNQVIVLEDLNESGFPIRKSHLSLDEIKVCLSWLAHFHAKFMGKEPVGLWEIGTYWHLETRKDEYSVMEDSKLKTYASQIDTLLNNCQFKTIVHGDAKVANFCFSENGNKVSAVDFQYVGGGCGMKDVIYLMGSCLTDSECRNWENELLDYYFETLETVLALENNSLKFTYLELEWREMYSIAWADFNRFLLGWMPTHSKLNVYSNEIVKLALEAF